jgi:hypothetical protein
MAYFAQIENNLVIDVIVISNKDCDDLPFPESEPIGQTFIASLGIQGNWLQTSYNGRFRKQFAGIGYEYNSTGDVYIGIQPYPNWILNDTYDWVPPVPYPTDGGNYVWDETLNMWVPVP